MKEKIYLDNNSSTHLDPAVIEAMISALKTTPSNPSSIHQLGREARSKLIEAKENIASFIHARPDEIIFTSSGTEGLNMTIRGVFGYQTKGHIITTHIEHSSVYNTIQDLEKNGCEVTYLETSFNGFVTSEQVQSAIRPNTRLIVLSFVNGETGVKTDISSIAQIAQKLNIPFVVDGVALLGKELFTIPQGVSAVCFSGHKIHGPQGIGFVWVKKNFLLHPLITGGGQEYGLRSGTENLGSIVGLSKAISLAKESLPKASYHMENLRNYFEHSLKEALQDVHINGLGDRVVNTTNLCFEGISAETMLMHLDRLGVYASHGSACSSFALQPSRVLLNMGYSKKRANSSIRFSFNRYQTKLQIDQALQIIINTVKNLRKLCVSTSV